MVASYQFLASLLHQTGVPFLVGDDGEILADAASPDVVAGAARQMERAYEAQSAAEAAGETFEDDGTLPITADEQTQAAELLDRLMAEADPAAALQQVTGRRRELYVPHTRPGARAYSDEYEGLVKRFTGDQKRVIRSVLIANNGMAAEKIILGLREYGRVFFNNPRAIRVVVMATPEDRKLGMRYIRDADQVIDVDAPLPGAAQPYGNIDLIVKMAKRYGVDAVHPGWGWASEDARLSEKLYRNGIIFMGPPHRAMKKFADKGVANFVFQQSEAGLACMIRWSGSHLKDPRGDPTAEDIRAFSVTNFSECRQVCEDLGYPVMIKARGVGGGRGMKRVFRPEDLTERLWGELVRAAKGTGIIVMGLAVKEQEVESVEGAVTIAARLKYPVYVKIGKAVTKCDDEGTLRGYLQQEFARRAEPMLTAVQFEAVKILGGGRKHIEVQVAGDGTDAVALGARDCSMQYDNQKRIEETAHLKDPALLRKIKLAAASVARSEGYAGFGTFEFLVDEESGDIVFLEVNTRIQVEHPVTEMDTDVRFIATHMLLSQGVKLANIPYIQELAEGARACQIAALEVALTRRLREQRSATPSLPSAGEAPAAVGGLREWPEFRELQGLRSTEPKLDDILDYTPETHTIALRIQSERLVGNKISAVPGQRIRLALSGIEGVWYYSSLEAEGEVGLSSDAQIGHVFITAKTREEAISLALRALDHIAASGEGGTNVAILRALLQTEEFRQNTYHNATMESLVHSGELKIERPSEGQAALIGGLLQAAFRTTVDAARFHDAVAKQQIPRVHELFLPAQRVVSVLGKTNHEFDAYTTGTNKFTLVSVRDPQIRFEGQVFILPRGAARVIVDGVQYYVEYFDKDDGLEVTINGLPETVLTRDIDPTLEKAAMPGRVISVLKQPGDRVEKGEVLLIVEAMKLEQKILAATAGTIDAVHVEPGQAVTAGAVLISYKATPEVLANQTTPYLGDYPEFSSHPSDPRFVDPERGEAVVDNLFNGFALPLDGSEQIGGEEPPPDTILSDIRDFYTPYMQRYLQGLTTRRYWGLRLEGFVSGYMSGMPEELYRELLAYARRLRNEDPQGKAQPWSYIREVQAILEDPRHRHHFEEYWDTYKDIDFPSKFKRFLAQEDIIHPVRHTVRRLLGQFAQDEALFADPRFVNPYQAISALHHAAARAGQTFLDLPSRIPAHIKRHVRAWQGAEPEFEGLIATELMGRNVLQTVEGYVNHAKEWLTLLEKNQVIKSMDAMGDWQGLAAILPQLPSATLSSDDMKVLGSVAAWIEKIRDARAQLGRKEVAIPRAIEIYLDQLAALEDVFRTLVQYQVFQLHLANIDGISRALDVNGGFRADSGAGLALARQFVHASLAQGVPGGIEERLRSIGRGADALMFELQAYLPSDAARLYTLARSHETVVAKGAAVLEILDNLEDLGLGKDDIAAELQVLAHFSGNGEAYRRGTDAEILTFKPTRLTYLRIAARATALLLSPTRPARDETLQLAKLIQAATGLPLDRYWPAMDRLRGHDVPIFGSLFRLMGQGPRHVLGDQLTREASEVQRTALTVYARRANRVHNVHIVANSPNHCSFVYRYRQGGGDAADSLPYDRFGQILRVGSVAGLAVEIAAGMPCYLQDRNERAGSSTALRGRTIDLREGENTLTCLIGAEETQQDEEGYASLVRAQLNTIADQLKGCGIKRVTVGIMDVGRAEHDQSPLYFTFKFDDTGGLYEDQVFRNLEPPLAFQLDFELMQGFHLRFIPSGSPNLHVFEAIQKEGLAKIDPLALEHFKQGGLSAVFKGLDRRRSVDTRLFVRALVRSNDFNPDSSRYGAIDRAFEQSLDQIQALQYATDPDNDPIDRGQAREIYLNILPPFWVPALNGEWSEDAELVRSYLEGLIQEHKDQLNLLKVETVTVRFGLRDAKGARQVYLYKAVNYPKTRFKQELLREEHRSSGAVLVHRRGEEVPLTPYAVMDAIDKRRQKAKGMGTEFAYDVPDLIRARLEEVWKRYPGLRPRGSILAATELFLLRPAREGDPLQLGEDLDHDRFKLGDKRKIGANAKDTDNALSCNAAAFRLRVKTPGCPEGREFLLHIANDISLPGGGPFNPRESRMQELVTERAVAEGIPLIAWQANQGANFGLENEIVKHFHVAFKDPLRGITQGNIDYLYLTQKDVDELKGIYQDRNLDDVIRLEGVEGKDRLRITSIPGATEGLGTDSLEGSGRQAGSAERARKEIYTAVVNSGYMTIGIGAYVFRLLGRAVQIGPASLTGYKLINAALELRAYLSEEQTSGRHILEPIGVTYWGADDDETAVDIMLRDLLAAAPHNKALPRRRPTKDTVSRSLTWPSPAERKRNRHAIADQLADFGTSGPASEVMAKFGTNVVCQVIDLGGLSLGLVTMESEPTRMGIVIPASPEDPNSHEITLPQPPFVLEPHGSEKLAEFVRMNALAGRGACVMPRVRGFLAGTLNMALGMLKSGAEIVGAIGDMRTPYYNYLEPGGELRGGAWVVFDRNVNGAARVRFYTAPEGRGGVLEPKMTMALDPIRKKYLAGVIKGLRADHRAALTEMLAELRAEIARLEVASQDVPKEIADRLAEVQRQLEETLWLYTFEPGAARTLLTAARRAGDGAEVERLQGQLDQYERLEAPAVAALMIALDLQDNGYAMEKRGSVDAQIPFEDLRRVLHRQYAIDLELLDFERQVEALYPSIPADELLEWRALYEARLNQVFPPDCNQEESSDGHGYIRHRSWTDAEWRGQAIAKIMAEKALRFIDDAFKADPSAAIVQSVRHMRGLADSMTGEEHDRVMGAVAVIEVDLANHVGAMIEAGQFVVAPSSTELQYMNLVRLLHPMGIFRSQRSWDRNPDSTLNVRDRSDHYLPRFYDHDMRVFLATVDGPVLTLRLEEGDAKGWGEALSRTLKRAIHRGVSIPYGVIVLQDTAGREIGSVTVSYNDDAAPGEERTVVRFMPKDPEQVVAAALDAPTGS